MMKPLMSAALGAAMLACALAPTTARAVDTKIYHGSDCKVFGATAWTDLNFTGFGVKNISATPRQVICPIIKDSDKLWDGGAINGVNGAAFSVFFRAEGPQASAACTMYVTSLDNTAEFRAYVVKADSLKAEQGVQEFTAGNIASIPGQQIWWYDKAYMLCNLGPGVRLTGYWFYEPGGAE